MSRDGHWAHQYTHTQYKCEYFTPMIEPPESVQIFLHVNTDFWSDVHALRAFEATGNLLVKPFFMSVSRPKEDKEKNAFKHTTVSNGDKSIQNEPAKIVKMEFFCLYAGVLRLND